MVGADLPLEFRQFEPEAPSDEPAPAAFVLHGRSADERELLPVVETLPDALHVVCFRAPYVLSKAAAAPAESDARDIVPWDHGGLAWYEPEQSQTDTVKPQPRADQLRRSLELLVESIDGAVRAFDLDPDGLGLLGFDQGAVMSLSLLFEAPERYAWVVALNGYLPVTLAALRPDGIAGTAVFVSAGEDDAMVPAARSVAAAELLSDLGADVTFELYASSHTVVPEEQRDVEAFVGAQLG